METIDIFKALSDEIRLRILRAVSIAELSVAEMVSVLGLPQSTVSRHLKPLRDAGLVEGRRDGTSVFYHGGASFLDPALSRLLQERLDDVPHVAEDAASVQRVMDLRRQRSRDFFDQIAGSYGSLTQPGGGWEALVAGLSCGFVGKRVADLGAGEGQLTLCLARFAEEVVAVDLSSRMLGELEERSRRAGVSDRVRVQEGDIEALPLGDESMDAVFLSQTLHHAARPEVAIAEASRVLRQGGVLVLLDLVRHDQEWVREQWADQWLGFDVEEIKTWMKAVGLEPVVTEDLPGSTPELAVLLAAGIKQASV